MKILQRASRNRHRVTCSDCSFDRLYDDPRVAEAITAYRNHDCSDDEEFCPRCLAGTESFEHFETCGVDHV